MLGWAVEVFPPACGLYCFVSALRDAGLALLLQPAVRPRSADADIRGSAAPPGSSHCRRPQIKMQTGRTAQQLCICAAMQLALRHFSAGGSLFCETLRSLRWGAHLDCELRLQSGAHELLAKYEAPVKSGRQQIWSPFLSPTLRSGLAAWNFGARIKCARP